MGHLLDTHCFLWAIHEPERLSRRAARLLTAKDSEVFLSVASLWEIAIKARSGKLDMPLDPEFFAQHMAALGARTLPIQLWHVNRLFDLPNHHRDPFDRMLVAQALVEKLTIVTADSGIARYDVPVLW